MVNTCDLFLALTVDTIASDHVVQEMMTTALKNLTLKAARHWVVNLILRIGSRV